MKLDNQLRIALNMIESYGGEPPLQAWLKNYFRHHPQMGSRDRKQVSDWIYGYYRLGHGFRDLTPTERLLTGIFLCSEKQQDLLEHLRPEWNKNISLSLPDKMSLLNLTQTEPDIFPWTNQLSEGIDPASFTMSHLKQPDLYLRIRPGYEDLVIKKLDHHQWPYEWIHTHTVRLPNGSKVDDLFELDREVVVQDLSSQWVAEFFSAALHHLGSRAIKAWDCCAGSGGKSILLHDLESSVTLTVSDIRTSILANLSKRFTAAGISRYRSFAADLSIAGLKPPDSGYDLIVADVPCSGSGTWGRTPDGLYFYDFNQTDRFQLLQRKIISNVIPFLKKEGIMVYISCSVFKKENEDQAELIRREFGMQQIRQETIRGYEQRADTMFASAFVSS
jgi:16S rRNA (cytosine967-C5)-methyltransferase